MFKAKYMLTNNLFGWVEKGVWLRCLISCDITAANFIGCVYIIKTQWLGNNVLWTHLNTNFIKIMNSNKVLNIIDYA